MAANDSVIALDYTPTLVELADCISHLPGFVYLDSGEREGSAELEIVTALPSTTHRLADYSNNLADWMTAVETELAQHPADRVLDDNDRFLVSAGAHGSQHQAGGREEDVDGEFVHPAGSRLGKRRQSLILLTVARCPWPASGAAIAGRMRGCDDH